MRKVKMVFQIEDSSKAVNDEFSANVFNPMTGQYQQNEIQHAFSTAFDITDELTAEQCGEMLSNMARNAMEVYKEMKEGGNS